MNYKTKSASALAEVVRSLVIEDGAHVEADWQEGGIVRATTYFRNGTREAGSYGITVTWWKDKTCLAERRSAFLVNRLDPNAVDKLANLALDCAEREEQMALFRLAKNEGVPYRIDGPTAPKTTGAYQFAVPRDDELPVHRKANARSFERRVKDWNKGHDVGRLRGAKQHHAPAPATATDALAAAVAAEAKEVGQ